MGAAAVAALGPSPASAQDPESSDTLTALRLDPADEVRLDGRLTESFWVDAQPIDDFRQWEPLEGDAATERTEVRLVFDDEALYVGILAFDSEPERIVARLVQRDRVMSEGFFGGLSFAGDDAVAVVLDPFHDHRNGVVLATNPNGAEFDALLTDEGGKINVDWRGVWDVRSARVPEGWSTEIAIPWRTLRYPDSPDGRVWGLNVYRMIQRKKEEVLWRSWDREGGGFKRISQAGHLAGLDGLPRPGLNLEVKPYLLGGTRQTRGDSGEIDADGTFDAGLDLKSELRPGLILDVTLLTDFAQVEVDDQQVNLTRFDLFFPEKRDFFLENAGIFEFGRPGQFETPPYLMFFSRQIGIGPDGEVPILGGGRLTGRVGGQTLGLLSIVTDEVTGREAEVFNVARLKRDVGESSYLGAMVTDRRGDGPANTVAGLDGQLFLHPTLAVEGFWARSFTEGAGGDGVVYQASLDLTTDRYGAFFQHFSVDPEAVAGAGFITRTDVRRTQLFARRRVRPHRLGLRLVDLRSNGQYQSTTDGRFQDWSWGPSLAPTWDSGDGGSVGLEFGETQVDEPFPLAGRIDVPAGRYRTDAWSADLTTSSARPWTVSARVRGAEFFGGDLLSMGTELALAPSPAFSFRVGFARNDIELPGGSFIADITTVRATWALSTRVVTNALVQYNSLTESFSTNVRFNFIHRPGSDFFLVLTELRGVDDDVWALVDRGLVGKLTYLVRF